MRKPTLIALSIFLVLGAFALFLEKGDTSGIIKVTPTPTTYLAFNASNEEIEKVAIYSSGNELIVVNDSSGGWRVVKPLGVEGDPGTIEEMITGILDLKVFRMLPATLTDAEIGGGNQADIWIEITYSAGGSEKVVVGNRTTTGSGYYARLSNGDAVLLRVFSVETILDLLQKLLLDSVSN